MKKYTDEWLITNNVTEQDIIDYQEGVKSDISSCKTSKYIIIVDVFWLEFLIPVFADYRFKIKVYKTGFIEATIYIK